MANKDEFGSIYDSMNYNYKKLEEIISYLYQLLEDNPADEKNRDLIGKLGNVALNMTDLQKDFTNAYGEASLKDFLVSNLDDRSNSLSKALENTANKSR